MPGETRQGAEHTTGDEPRVSRRDVLRTGAAALAVGAVGGSVAGSAAAATGDYPHLDVPEHVTISTDPAGIEPWQPRLTWGAEYPDQDPLGYYSFRVSSPEYADDCVVGFHKYEKQDGVSEHDSHDGDHEPVYVFFDSDTGDVTNVVCSGYHWFRSKIPASSIRLVDTDRGQQPVLRVVDPWHHHLPVQPEQGWGGRTFDVETLDAAISEWLTNDMASELRTDQPYLPWRMRSAEDWWREGALRDVEILMQRIWVRFGIGDVPDRGETGWSY